MKDDLEESIVLKSPMPQLNAWNIPLGSGTDLLRHPNPRESKAVELTFEPKLLTVFKKDLINLEMHFCISERNKVFKAVTFERVDGRFLPIKTIMYRNQGDTPQVGVLSTVTTKWGRASNDGYVPVSAELSMILGNPTKPSTTKDFELTFDWVIGENLSPAVFETSGDSFVSANELREAILENAEGIRD